MDTESKKTLRNFLFIIMSIFLVGVIVYEIVNIINTNKTIDSLSAQIEEPYTSIAPAAEYANDYQAKIAELESFYMQKESVIEGYRSVSERTKLMYKENEDFEYVYSHFLDSLEQATYYYHHTEEFSEKYDFDCTIARCAFLCAIFDTYIKDNTQRLNKANEYIDAYRSESSSETYNMAKEQLEAIVDLDL